MLRYSLGLAREAGVVENAVNDVLEGGFRTYDIMSEGNFKVSTSQMSELIIEKITG